MARTRTWLDWFFGPWVVRFLGTEYPERPVIELEAGTGVTIVVADVPSTDATKVTFSATSGGGGDITFSAAIVQAHTTIVRCGARVINPSAFPAAPTSATFRATIESSSHSAAWAAQVRLFDLTNNVVVTASTLTNEAAVDRSLAQEVSATLTLGSGAGEIRPTATMYAAQLVAIGTPGVDDRAILSNARVEFGFE